jgi:multiple antibiotic resistance protein
MYAEMTIAIIINILIVYIVLRYLYLIQNRISESTLMVMRKLFGVILLAISVGMITLNLGNMIVTNVK